VPCQTNKQTKQKTDESQDVEGMGNSVQQEDSRAMEESREKKLERLFGVVSQKALYYPHVLCYPSSGHLVGLCFLALMTGGREDMSPCFALPMNVNRK
jgi:hypothetical protein